MPAKVAAVLLLYGVAHLVVDANCAAAVFCVASIHNLSAGDFVAMLVLYQALAFGLQPIFGLAVDAAGSPRSAAFAGCLLTAVAVLLPASPMLAIVVAGVGSALFHVGGGVVSLRLTPHRATAPGLFVAPGSAGLLLGMFLGHLGQAASAPLVPVAILPCLLLARARVPGSVPVTAAAGMASGAELVIGFVLLSIAIRSLLGALVTFPWQTRPVELILLTTALVAGKALGGIFADRWGWVRVGVGAMVAATPFLACASTYPLAAIPGLFLVNLTMAVTLTAVAEAVPTYPGFAFGLTCLALLLGALPSLLGVHVGGPVAICLAIPISSVALYRGLRLLICPRSSPRPIEVFK